jgi:hypothetical protein
VLDLYRCPTCAQAVYAANTVCLHCGTPLGFDPAVLEVVVADPARRCANAGLIGCSWLADVPGALCRSCALTRTRPADDDAVGLAQLAVAEAEKRRLVHQLLALGLPVEPRDEAAGTGLAFDLLSSSQEPVTTGHVGGVITLDLAESDDVHRERLRDQLGEPYRTVLGHFRHEVGHHYFTVLVDDDQLAEARALFGDETADYGAALDRHYREGPPPGWEASYVSAYATMHPAEDWAETFAHYLHIRAVLATAAAYGLRVDGATVVELAQDLTSDPAEVDAGSVEAIIEAWLPLSYALNAVSRSIGRGDLYPFVLPPPVLRKLAFVHRAVYGGG